jgi:hypothetical protein
MNFSLAQLTAAKKWIETLTSIPHKAYANTYLHHLQLTGSATPNPRDYGVMRDATACWIANELKRILG